MSDSTRPAAPYLPQEITSRILYYIPLKLESRTNVVREYQSISLLARISDSFRVEVQKKLISSIYIISLAQLRKLVANFPLGLLQHSQSLRLHRIPFTLEYSSLLFSVLQSTKNLKHLQIDNLSVAFTFDVNQTEIMRSTAMLPHLNSLQIHLTEATISNLILSTEPNIETLTVTTQESYVPYIGAPFTSSLNGLRELSLAGICGTQILKGKIFPVVEFKGLTFLQLGSLHIEREDMLDFFQIIGPSLLEAKLDQVCFSLFEFMSVLKRLQTACVSVEKDFLAIPTTVTKLAVDFIATSDQLPWSRLTKLQELEIASLMVTIDLSSIPQFKVLKISFATVEMILASLKDSVIGSGLEKLELSRPMPGSRNSRVRERCKELGIELRAVDHFVDV